MLSKLKVAAIVVAVIGAAAFSGGHGKAVHADSSSRPIKFSSSFCGPDGSGTICFVASGQTQGVFTPSGVSMVKVHEESTVSFTEPGCSFTDTVHSKSHDLELSGSQVHEFHQQYSEVFAVNCPIIGFVQTCVSTLDVHVVDGNVQFNRNSFSCS